MDSNLLLLKAQIENRKKALLNDNGLISLTNLLESHFQEIVNSCREFRERIFTPMTTIMLFIKQVLNPDKSCQKAVSDFVAEQLKQGFKHIPSSNTGPYSKARQRLPEEMVKTLVKMTAEEIEKKVGTAWKAYGREIKVVDGTTVKMADTKANQESFPQHWEQKMGVGFPIARLLVVMSLTVGTVINYALAAYEGKGTGEQSLLRKMEDGIKTNDIVLGDRNFPDYFFIADLQALGADGIFKGHAQRHYDFRKGEKLGKKDHIACWKKPQRPTWMDEKTYKCYPSELKVREFKVAGAIYVTTFLNSKRYVKRELAEIYKLRWQIEINLRNIKDTMNMEMLSCKSPEMIKKEIGIHFLAFNFIKILIAEASQRSGHNPRKISFKGAVQLLNSFMPYFISGCLKDNKKMYEQMLSLIVKNIIGNRPGRVEPRKIKQRGSLFKFLNKPRYIEKNKLEKEVSKRIAKYAGA